MSTRGNRFGTVGPGWGLIRLALRVRVNELQHSEEESYNRQRANAKEDHPMFSAHG
jgi:hypothetical protein